MLTVHMSAYPWDIVDTEASDLLDRLQGESGVSGLSISVAMPSVITLQAQPVTPRVYRTRGGVFFHPTTARYEDTRCKPIASSWIKSRDPFAKIASTCCDRGLSLRAVVSATRTGRLALRYPELACKNVFGDVSQESLCLSNGDVQAYLCDIVADLSSTYSLSAVLLEDIGCQWSEAWHSDLKAPASLGTAARKLLGLCFCESCYQQAGIANLDLANVRDWVANLLNQVMQKGPADDSVFASAIADSDSLLEHNSWLNNSFVDVLTNARQSCQCELGLYASKNIDQASVMAQSANLDLIIINHETTDSSNHIIASHNSAEHKVRLETKLNTQAIGHGSADLVNAFQSAAQQGYAGIEVGPFNHFAEDTFSSLKQAIRFARRSHTS